MEESKELVEASGIRESSAVFISCCPAWVKFCENRYPQFRKNLSTCRSPQAMFGALLKEEARTEEKRQRRKERRTAKQL
ncbi:MAG: [Fe-Fe] hydrogenase large subunit C-terminal domain-containing protein [Mediterraneibacter gnavus]